MFESHLYGIETIDGQAVGLAAVIVWIAPLWNWNPLAPPALLQKRRVWIAPLWNWNYAIGCIAAEYALVWIAPLWNWNWHISVIPAGHVRRLNRTSMELKQLTGSTTVCAVASFESHLYGIETVRNRETCYLSCEFESHLYGIETRLKLHPSSQALVVWIAPLWNWNLLVQNLWIAL